MRHRNNSEIIRRSVQLQSYLLPVISIPKMFGQIMSITAPRCRVQHRTRERDTHRERAEAERQTEIE